MEPRIEHMEEKKLVGPGLEMSMIANRTVELWRGFMQRRNEITSAIGKVLYSMQVYDPMYFNPFDPGKQFRKWAATEVANFDAIPNGMEAIVLPSGKYAVFLHKGSASEGAKTFQYIFAEWLPKSGYTLDNRPHFEILGEKYRNDHPDSEEEIWIPIKPAV